MYLKRRIIFFISRFKEGGLFMKKSVKMFGAAILVSSALVGGAFAQINQPLPSPGGAPAGSPVAKHGALKVSGNKIVDKDNNAVKLRGMSFYWAGLGEVGLGDPYYNDAVVGWLAHDFKASVVRAAIPATKNDGVGMDNEYRGVTSGYADGDSALMVRKTIAVVEACIKRGMYVIIDWHTHNKSGDGRSYSAKGAEFLGNMAKKYGQYPNVLFEPFNEPVESNSSVANYVNPIITAIRQSSQNIIIVGSDGWSSQPNGVNVNGTNIAYSYHFYANTHSKGAKSGDVDAALNNNKAVFVTEFGTTSANGKTGHNPGASDEWITYLEGKNVSWVNWEVGHRDEESAILSASASTGGPWSLKAAGTWVRNKIINYNGSSGANYYPTTTYTVNVTAGEGGTVQKKVNGSVNNGPYSWKNVVIVKAVPNAGWEIKKWTGDAYGSNDSLDITMYGLNYNLGVTFYNGGVIKNGHFASGITNWGSYKNGLLSPAPAGTIEWDNANADNPMLKATITSAGTNPEDISVYQTGLKLEQARKYELSFEAKSASARKLVARVSNGRSASSAVYLSKEVSLGTTVATFKESFNMGGATITNGRLDFDLGGNAAAVSITNVRLLDVGAGTGVVRGAVSKPTVDAWSIANVGGVPRLRGPAEAGATVSLYDTRGKLVKSMSAVDGLDFGGAGISAGRYLAVVKDRSGAEVLRSKVVMSR